MLTLIVPVLFLLSYDGSLAIKCVSVNNQPCMVRQMLIDFHPDELHYYPFIIGIDSCDGSCSAVQYPFGKMFVPKKQKM